MKIKKYTQFLMKENLETSFISIPNECFNLKKIFGNNIYPEEVIKEYNEFVEEVELVGYKNGKFIDNNGDEIESISILMKLNDFKR